MQPLGVQDRGPVSPEIPPRIWRDFRENVSARSPRSFLFHSLQSLVCVRSIPAVLFISLSPVPYLCLLIPSGPLYFTLSSPLFVSARSPWASLFHSLQSLICVRSISAFLFILLSPVPYLSPLDHHSHTQLCFTLLICLPSTSTLHFVSLSLFASLRARKRSLRGGKLHPSTVHELRGPCLRFRRAQGIPEGKA